MRNFGFFIEGMMLRPFEYRTRTFRCFLRSMSLIGISAYFHTITALAEVTTEDFKLRAADSFEGAIDFIGTVDFALFAATGFFLRRGLAGRKCGRILQLSFLVLFLIANIISMISAYISRMQLVGQMASGTIHLNSLSVELPGWATLFAGLCVIVIGAASLSEQGDHNEG